MPCYICTHCNKCGLFSMKLDLTCATCGEPIRPGSVTCPKCGQDLLHNMKSGGITKPKGSKDYYTEQDKATAAEGSGGEQLVT